MSISEKPWGNFSAGDYADVGAYCDACLVNDNSGPRTGWTKGACKVPVHEPGGMLNRNAVHAAAARLTGADLTGDQQMHAAMRLVTLYGQLKETPPPSIAKMGNAPVNTAVRKAAGMGG